MKLTEIDQNFQLKTAITEPDIVWLDITGPDQKNALCNFWYFL